MTGRGCRTAPPPFACPRRARRAHWAGGHHREGTRGCPRRLLRGRGRRDSHGSATAGGVGTVAVVAVSPGRIELERVERGATRMAARRGTFGTSLARTHAAGASGLRCAPRRMGRSALHRSPPPARGRRRDVGCVLRPRPGAALPRDRRGGREHDRCGGRAGPTSGRRDRRRRLRRRRAAGPDPRRPLERERAVVVRRRRAHRPRGARRPPRDRPRDARALRLSRSSTRCSRRTTAHRRSGRAGASGSRCTSCIRSRCTPPGTVAATAWPSPRPPSAVLELAGVARE